MAKRNTPQMIILDGDGTFPTEVVGESHYFQNLRKIAGANDDDDVEVVKTGYLVPEPNNPNDPNSIRVDVDQLTVGHLPRPAAAMLSPVLRQARLVAVQVQVQITAFEGASNYSVWADGDLNEIPRMLGVLSQTAPGRRSKGGCRRWLLYGVIALAALFGCVIVATLMTPRTSTTETPERSAGVVLPTEERTAQPTWTNTPEAATATPAPPTATAVPATATPAPPAATLAPAAATATNTPEPATAAPAPIGAVANDIANLREGPGTDYPVIGSAAAGQVMEPVGQNSAGDWLQLASGAWIAAALVDNVPGGLPVTAASERPAPIVEVTPTVAAVPIVEVTPTVAAGPICGCAEDLYKCADFATQANAQACFNYCIAQGAGDIHRLDQDNNQIVCE